MLLKVLISLASATGQTIVLVDGGHLYNVETGLFCSLDTPYTLASNYYSFDPASAPAPAPALLCLPLSVYHKKLM